MSSATNKIELSDGTVVRCEKYHAPRFAAEAARPGMKRMVVLGDVDDKWGRFWVVRPVDARKLEAAGFEIASPVDVLEWA